MNKNKDNHIVYAAHDVNGNCLYIGEGQPYRYKHITSGTSHIYEANRLHFAGVRIIVEVLHTGLTKKESERIESELIKEMKPLWNKGVREGYSISVNKKKYCMDRFKRCFKTRGIPRSDKIKDYEEIIHHLAKITDNEGVCRLSKGQNIGDLEIPQGFLSKLANAGNDSYYPYLREVFDFSRCGQTGTYTVRIKDWKK